MHNILGETDHSGDSASCRSAVTAGTSLPAAARRFFAGSVVVQRPDAARRLSTGNKGAASCEHGNEPFGSIKDGIFVYQLSDYQLSI
jgi:hypothetical protein